MKLTLAQRIENMFTFLYAEPDGSMCHFDKTFLDEVRAAAIRGAAVSETDMPQEDHLVVLSDLIDYAAAYCPMSPKGREEHGAAINNGRKLLNRLSVASTRSATRRVEPDNVGDTDRWQDPRDLSGGATDAPDDKNGIGTAIRSNAGYLREVFGNGGMMQGPEAEMLAQKLDVCAARVEALASATRLNDELRAAWESRDKWQAEAERLAVELRATR